MTTTVPPFPVDDVTLDAVEHALDGALKFEDGEPQLVGADYSLSQLLDFLSGYDPSKVVDIERPHCAAWIDADVTWTEYTGGPLYHLHDVIRALVAEVRRLRSEA